MVDTSSATFVIYPNPAENRLFFKNISSENLILYIYDVKGIKISTRKILTSEGLDVSYLPTGMYILQINDGSNQLLLNLLKIKFIYNANYKSNTKCHSKRI